MTVMDLTNETLKSFIANNEKPVMVVYYDSDDDQHYGYDAVIEHLEAGQDTVAIGRLDATRYPETAEYYNAKWYPTTVIYDQGEVQDYSLGPGSIEDVIDKFPKYFDANAIKG